MFRYPENEYQYVYYDRKFFVIPKDYYEEYMSMKRDSVTPKVDPYKFSVAMISRVSRRMYITLTNYEFEYDVGFKRDWTALKEGVDDGLRLFQELIDSHKQKPKKKKRFIIV